MPYDISPALLAHFSSGATTLATILELHLIDGSGIVLRFTSLDHSLDYGGNTYLPTVGVLPSAHETKIDLAVDNMSIVGVIDGVNITYQDVLAGRLNYADLKIARLNYKDPDGMGDITFIEGKIGRVQLRDTKFVSEARGLTQYFQQNIGTPYTIDCPVKRFGDSKCTVNLATYTKTFTVTSVSPGAAYRVFQTDLTDPDNHFNLGLVLWTSGDNNWFKMDVKKYLNANGEVELYEPLPFEIQVGHTGDIVTGCDRKWSTCKSYNNELNYRGFRFLPGVSQILRGRR